MIINIAHVCVPCIWAITITRSDARRLPFEVDGEEPLDLGGAAANGGSEGLALAVAEEQHLQHVGVVHRHASARHLPVGVLVLECTQKI